MRGDTNNGALHAYEREGEAMTDIRQMLEAHPRRIAIETGVLVACIEACADCALSCAACADACLGERNLEMLIRCIRLWLDCGDVCATTGRLLSRQTEFDAGLARAAEACRRCGAACEEVLSALPA
jgi:hypothetical protein